MPWKKGGSPRKKLFLAHYLNVDNPATFLRVADSAMAAGYSAKTAKHQGHLLKKECEAEIAIWMDEEGLSKGKLFAKLMELLEATEIKFFQKDGEIITREEVKALHIQVRALEMALRCKGLLDPDKQDTSLQPLPWSD